MIASLFANARLERILRLLDQERATILNGPLSRLAGLVERREAAIAELLEARAELPEAFLEALKSRAERNSRLLLASLAGLKAAQTHLAELETARESLRTYTATGASVDVRKAPATHDQRA
jgi:hypothetical protein